jgi:hypothetical protein
MPPHPHGSSREENVSRLVLPPPPTPSRKARGENLNSYLLRIHAADGGSNASRTVCQLSRSGVQISPPSMLSGVYGFPSNRAE